MPIKTCHLMKRGLFYSVTFWWNVFIYFCILINKLFPAWPHNGSLEGLWIESAICCTDRNAFGAQVHSVIGNMLFFIKKESNSCCTWVVHSPLLLYIVRAYIPQGVKKKNWAGKLKVFIKTVHCMYSLCPSIEAFLCGYILTLLLTTPCYTGFKAQISDIMLSSSFP